MVYSVFDLVAIFLTLSAIIGWLNLKLFRLPTGVAMLIIGLVTTLALVGVDRLAPGLGVGPVVGQFVAQVDFSTAVLRFMLAYLLFAGAMHVDFDALKRRAWTAAALATFGGLRMLADLLLLAACGGLFSVPLYAIIQEVAQPDQRSRMVAANNIVNALFMVLGAAAAAGLSAAGLDAPQVLRVAAGANLVAAAWITVVVRRAALGGKVVAR